MAAEKRNPTLEKVNEALDRSNFDYAIALLLDYVKANPEDLDERKRLRAIEVQRIREGSAPGFLARGKVRFVASKGSALQAAGKHEAAMGRFEDALALDPEDSTALSGLGRAAMDAGYVEVAIDSFERVVATSPRDANALRNLARAYEEAGELKMALNRWDALSQINPEDREAQNKRRELSGVIAIEDGKWDDEGGFRDKVADNESAQQAERRHALMDESDVDRAIRHTREQIEAEPTRGAHYIRLADLLVRKKQYKSAVEVVRQGKKKDPVNYNFEIKLGEITQAAYANELAKVKAKLLDTPEDEELLKRKTGIEKAMLKHRVETLTKHTANQPANKSYPMELGRLLFETGQVDEAIRYLQESQNDPRLRVNSRRLLGHCMMAKGLYRFAVDNYKKAIEDCESMDDTKKDILYNLGLALDAMDNDEGALDAFQQIFNVDINYRDVKDRVETLYKKTSGQ